MGMPTLKQKIGIVVGLLSATVPVVTGSYHAVVWAADQRYVTQSSMEDYIREQKIQSVAQQLDQIELKILYGEATNAEKALYEKLKREREQLLKSIFKEDDNADK